MGKNKLVGYALAAIGLIGLALISPMGKSVLPVMEGVNQQSVTIGSLCFVILGILIVSIFSKKGGGGIARQAEKEVPIYKGKKIVGYREEE